MIDRCHRGHRLPTDRTCYFVFNNFFALSPRSVDVVVVPRCCAAGLFLLLVLVFCHFYHLVSIDCWASRQWCSILIFRSYIFIRCFFLYNQRNFALFDLAGFFRYFILVFKVLVVGISWSWRLSQVHEDWIFDRTIPVNSSRVFRCSLHIGFRVRWRFFNPINLINSLIWTDRKWTFPCLPLALTCSIPNKWDFDFQSNDSNKITDKTNSLSFSVFRSCVSPNEVENEKKNMIKQMINNLLGNQLWFYLSAL